MVYSSLSKVGRLLALVGLTATLGLSTPAPARAQDPRSEVARAELAELAVELRLESIERIVGSIADRLSRLDPAKAELVRARLQPGREFARSHLASDMETLLRGLFEAELRTNRLVMEDLKVDLNLFRAYDSAWRVRPVDVPTTRTGFSPPRSVGYPAEVAAIDPALPHSMHDLRDYLADRFTLSALERIVSRGLTVEVHVGTRAEALSDLVNRGYRVLGEVRAPNGSYEHLLLTEAPNGSVRYVVTGTIDGLDRVRHLTSLLRFAGNERRGVPNDRIEIVGDVEAMKERNYRAMRDAMERIGLGGDTALIGFRATLKNELTERALARRGAEHLRDVLGADPYEGLRQRLTAARDALPVGPARAEVERALAAVSNDATLRDGMNRAPERVLGNIADLKAMIAAEKKLVDLAKKNPRVELLQELVADGKLRLPGGVSAKEATIARAIESGALKADELRVTTSRGVETVKLVSNYYGDALGDVARALIDSGHRRLAYFGTAGGTVEGARVGDIHVPERFSDFRFQPAGEGVRNAFLDMLAGRETALGERLRLGTHLTNVFSPAEETMRWLEETRSRGIHAVEVENSYLAREVARHNRVAADKVTFWTSVIISDIPGGAHTLGNSNSATTHTFERMVDLYLEALGIKDIEVRAKDNARFSSRPLPTDPREARALEVADKLVPRNLPRSNFLRDRIAGIVGTLSGEALEAIDTSKKLKPRDIPGLSEEARVALEAEVAGAYTDAERLAALERANAVVSRLAAELRRAHPNANFELRAGGGIERGMFSPVSGLTLEVVGDAAVRATAEARLPALLAEHPNSNVRLAPAGANAVSLGRGEVFAVEPQPLVREDLSRALSERGVNVRGATVEYAGREHDVNRSPSTLFSRFELASTGPVATEAEVARFAERIARYGARIERVPASDPRLGGAQARTMVDAHGNTVVLLPSDRPVRRYALIDELTHSIQLDRMRRTMGAERVVELFRNAQAGDPGALSTLLRWEIEAKRMVRLTLPENHPDRALLDREIERLRRVLDPYLDVRAPNGRVDWAKVRRKAREHGEGAASFLLGLFLKDLAKLVATGDREAIELFFEGLATTEFWSHYGLFVIGAEAGSTAYVKFLQRHVKPSFVNTVLKSNVALATGMALPMIVHSDWDTEVYAVNLAGLMLSSASVKAGLSAIRWVMPIQSASRWAPVARALKIARGVPGWVYHGVELAVVLYFAEEISERITAVIDERRARGEVADSAAAVLAAARAAGGADDPALDAALDRALDAYVNWRDRSLQPAMAAMDGLRREMERAGRSATIAGTGASRFDAIASRYEALGDHVDRYRERSEAATDARVDAAVARFSEAREAALRRAYHDNVRARAYDPVRGARDVSDNRRQAYDDEAALYEAAAAVARSPEVAEALRERARITRDIRDRERALLDPLFSAPSSTPGLGGAIEREVGR
ncbi:MAG: hypothetical protein M9894_03665 [Planctomycetes bacterium]|nr:hypothetical protein [Planctomycetota bacterium]